MNETDARRIARERSITLQLPYRAITRDQVNGYWERSDEWGVLTPDGTFVTDPKELTPWGS